MNHLTPGLLLVAAISVACGNPLQCLSSDLVEHYGADLGEDILLLQSVARMPIGVPAGGVDTPATIHRVI